MTSAANPDRAEATEHASADASTDPTSSAPTERSGAIERSAGSDGNDPTETPDADGEASSEDTGPRSRLEEEGDVAADYLEELLDIADLDGDIDIDVDHGRAAVAVVAEAEQEQWLRRLVGANGEVLDALQELTRLAVQVRTGERSRLMLDIAGYRRGRKAELTVLAQSAIDEVTTTGHSVSLDPMNPFERKIVHDAVAAAGLHSDSEGVEPNRRVVIRPS